MRAIILFSIFFAEINANKSELDCDELEMIETLWEGKLKVSRDDGRFVSGKDIPKLEKIKHEKAMALCKSKETAKKRISQHAAKSFLFYLTGELTKFNKNFSVSSFFN